MTQTWPPLPEDFLFGVCTADHQCESVPSDPQQYDIWDWWETIAGVGTGRAARKRAVDLWNCYETDMRNAQAMGCRAFRFSIAWARVQPRFGEFDAQALAHYVEMARFCRSLGMEPIITLFHFVWPWKPGEEDFMAVTDARDARYLPERFARYTRYVFDGFCAAGVAVKYWITFNEPNGMVTGFFSPWWAGATQFPPGVPESLVPDTAAQLERLMNVVRNLFEAHRRAYEILHSNANFPTMVSSNIFRLQWPERIFGQRWLARAVRGWQDQRMRTLQPPKPRPVSAPGVERLIRRDARGAAKIDLVISALTATPERREHLLFSEPYFGARRCALVRRARGYRAWGDLAGWCVAVFSRSTAASGPAGTTAVPYPDYASAFDALERGWVEAIIGDDVLLRNYARRALATDGWEVLYEPERGDAAHYVAYAPPGGLSAEALVATDAYAVGVRLRRPELLRAVNVALARITAEPDWQKECLHYTGLPPRIMRLDPRAGDEAAVPLTFERAALDLEGRLVVGVRADLPGFSERGADGQWQGLEIELAYRLAEALGVPRAGVQFVAITLEERVAAPEFEWSSITRVLADLKQFLGPLATFTLSDWWHAGMAGQLPDWLCPPACRVFDYVAFDYYYGVPDLRLSNLDQLMLLIARQYDKTAFWPGGLYQAMRDFAHLFPDKPQFIIENGRVDDRGGPGRGAHLFEHIGEIQRALQDTPGLRVLGYLHWSLTSNREWGLVFGKRSDFGLYFVDLDNLPEQGPPARTASQGVCAYAELIRRRGV